MGEQKKNGPGASGSGDGVYWLGVIGAGVFYWRRADEGFGPHAKAIGKALVWPAFVVHQLLESAAAAEHDEELV